uniref:Uncharacterized protein n=1 Tax=Picea sitchensis TaxID=3332 RepID=D5ADF9_PICSI|nr:unknown [Picea sitchensis]
MNEKCVTCEGVTKPFFSEETSSSRHLDVAAAQQFCYGPCTIIVWNQSRC